MPARQGLQQTARAAIHFFTKTWWARFCNWSAVLHRTQIFFVSQGGHHVLCTHHKHNRIVYSSTMTFYNRELFVTTCVVCLERVTAIPGNRWLRSGNTPGSTSDPVGMTLTENNLHCLGTTLSGNLRVDLHGCQKEAAAAVLRRLLWVYATPTSLKR